MEQRLSIWNDEVANKFTGMLSRVTSSLFCFSFLNLLGCVAEYVTIQMYWYIWACMMYMLYIFNTLSRVLKKQSDWDCQRYMNSTRMGPPGPLVFYKLILQGKVRCRRLVLYGIHWKIPRSMLKTYLENLVGISNVTNRMSLANAIPHIPKPHRVRF